MTCKGNGMAMQESWKLVPVSGLSSPLCNVADTLTQACTESLLLTALSGVRCFRFLSAYTSRSRRCHCCFSATGALEILIGLDILGVPSALMGNYSEMSVRISLLNGISI